MAITSFRFYIDGTLIEDEPIGLDDFKVVIERDEENRFIGIKYPISLQFIGDGYSLIKQRLRTYGRNKALSFEIQESYDVESGFRSSMVGSILLSEGLDNYYQKIWNTQIRDENYSKYIYNNKEQQIRLDLTSSVNGVTITPPTAFNLGVARPTRYELNTQNEYIGENLIDCNSYDLMSLMTYIIDYMTDGSVSISSSWYNGLGYGICVVPLSSMKETYDIDTISFDDVFLTVSRIYNLWLGGSGNSLVLETNDWFNSRNTSIEFENQITEQSYNPLFIYNKIKIGYDSLTSLNTIATLNLGSINSRLNINTLFKQTELNSLSTLNSSEELDLTPKLMVNPLEPAHSIVSKRNNQSMTIERLTGIVPQDFPEDINNFSFENQLRPEPSNHLITTYNKSNNNQNILYSNIYGDDDNYATLSTELTNANTLNRYKLTSDYTYKDVDRIVWQGGSSESGIAKSNSQNSYSIKDLITDGACTNVADFELDSDYIGQEVTIRFRVMLPIHLLGSWGSTPSPEYGEPDQDGTHLYWIEESPFYSATIPEMTLKIFHYEDGVDLSTTNYIATPMHGVVYEHTKTFTPSVALDQGTTIGSISCQVFLNDGLGSELTKYYYFDFIDCVIEKTTSQRIDVEKSSDAKSTILSFDNYLSEDQRNTMIQSPFASINVDGKTCYHNKTMISLVTGETEFELLTDSDKFEDEHII